MVVSGEHMQAHFLGGRELGEQGRMGGAEGRGGGDEWRRGGDGLRDGRSIATAGASDRTQRIEEARSVGLGLRLRVEWEEGESKHTLHRPQGSNSSDSGCARVLFSTRRRRSCTD